MAVSLHAINIYKRSHNQLAALPWKSKYICCLSLASDLLRDLRRPDPQLSNPSCGTHGIRLYFRLRFLGQKFRSPKLTPVMQCFWIETTSVPANKSESLHGELYPLHLLACVNANGNSY